jgi:hypothetical protein
MTLPFWRAGVRNGKRAARARAPVWQRLAIDSPVWQSKAAARDEGKGLAATCPPRNKDLCRRERVSPILVCRFEPFLSRNRAGFPGLPGRSNDSILPLPRGERARRAKRTIS